IRFSLFGLLTAVYSDRSFTSLSAAIFVSSGLPKVENLKNPSPQEPKPSPGVPTICAFSRRKSKNSQLLIPRGHFIQIYGAFLPPQYHIPSLSSASVRYSAFFL